MTPDEARNWFQSLTILQEGFSGRASIDQEALRNVLTCFARRELASQADLRQRFHQVAGSSAAIGSLRLAAENSPPITLEALHNQITEAVAGAIKLCRASMDTGNPIHIHW